MDSYWKKGSARTVRRKVTGSDTTTTDSCYLKEPTRRVRETVLGFRIIGMGLLTQDSQGPIKTVRRSNRFAITWHTTDIANKILMRVSGNEKAAGAGSSSWPKVGDLIS